MRSAAAARRSVTIGGGGGGGAQFCFEQRTFLRMNKNYLA